MAKLRNKDWWLGRTDEQQQRKQAARQQWREARGKPVPAVPEERPRPEGSSTSEDPESSTDVPMPPDAADHPHTNQIDSQAGLDRFYELQGAIEEAKAQRDFNAALQLATDAAALLAAFVAAWKAEEVRLAATVGQELSDEWFRIKSIVAVDTICDLAPARRDDNILRWLRGQLAATPELAPWIPRVDQALADVGAARQLVAEIEREPGIEQAGLANRLGLDGHRARSILYWMEQDGTVSRQKSGRTYSLYLAKPRTPDP